MALDTAMFRPKVEAATSQHPVLHLFHMQLEGWGDVGKATDSWLETHSSPWAWLFREKL